MRIITTKKIKEVVTKLCIEANINIRKDVLIGLKEAVKRETKKIAKDILVVLVDNARVAKIERLPICQDTGMVVVFVKIGQDVKIRGGDIKEAINDGVRNAYKNFRKSIVRNPLYRKNTGDNTPAVIHFDIIKGKKIEISVLLKGFGSENKSRIAMLEPSATIEDVKQFIIDSVMAAGPDACPPFVVGIGIGGTLDKAVLLSKEALLRSVNSNHPDRRIARFEEDLLKEINKLGIGPMGLGGKTTALGVNILTYPTHIAGFPIAVNISCHALRSARKVLL